MLRYVMIKKDDFMRLGWAKTKYSISYYVKKTVYVDGKNKDLVIKRLGSEKSYVRHTV